MTLLLSCWPLSTAHAGNDDEFFVGQQAALTGGAVTASVRDGSAAYYNPAGLGAIERATVDVSASVYALRYHSASSFLVASSGASQGADVVEFLSLPTEVAFVRGLSDNVVLGLGYYTPRASEVLLSERLAFTEGADTSTWAFDFRVTNATRMLGAGLGVRFGPRLRFGVSAFGIYEDWVESAAIFGSVVRSGTPVTALQLSILGKASRLSTELGVGVQWEVSDTLVLGASVRGPRLQLYRGLDEAISSAITRLQSTEGVPLEVFSDEVRDTSDHLGWLRVGRYRLGAALRVGPGKLSADVDLQPGLDADELDVVRDPVVNLRVGGTWPVSSQVVLGGGVFTDHSPTPSDGSDERINFYGAALGLELRQQLGLATSESADSLVLSTVFAIRYAYGVGTLRSLQVGAGEDEQPFQTEQGDSELFNFSRDGHLRVHELGLNVGSVLRF